MKVSVSILKEYDRLINAVKLVNESTSDFLHIDVMDGKFVNNTKFPYEVVKDIKLISKKPLDIHLMVDSLEEVKKYAELLPEMITFHVEILDDFKIIDYLKGLGIKIGLAVNPETNIESLTPYLEDIDLVLFMSVHPGLPGQEFINDVVDKIKEFKTYAPNDILISIDGGVNDKNVSLCKYAGCDIVVCGSYITDSLNYDDNISKIKNI